MDVPDNGMYAYLNVDYGLIMVSFTKGLFDGVIVGNRDIHATPYILSRTSSLVTRLSLDSPSGIHKATRTTSSGIPK
jgi:hypothetical protein